jgi:hypothetical protein
MLCTNPDSERKKIAPIRKIRSFLKPRLQSIARHKSTVLPDALERKRSREFSAFLRSSRSSDPLLERSESLHVES